MVAKLDEIEITEEEIAARKIDVLFNDSKGDLVKELKLETGPAKGSVVLVKDNPNNANTWYFNYTPDSTHYQYLKAGETATESFTYMVTDAKGLSATGAVNINILGVNDEAVITFDKPRKLIEDENSSTLSLIGSVKLEDKDQNENNLLTFMPDSGNLGSLTQSPINVKDPNTDEVIATNYLYYFTFENSKVQYLAQGQIKQETFTMVSKDGTSKTLTFEIVGVNDAAVIGDPTNTQVTEDAGDIVDGFITLTGDITITDADNGEAFFQTQVISSATNKGSLTLQSNGSYTYKVSNAGLQSLNASDYLFDDFTIFAKDGTDKTIRITINGADDGEFIGDSLTKKLIEDKDVNSQGRIVFQGTLLISGEANQVANPFVSGAENLPNNIGTFGLNENGQYFYGIANIRIQFLGEGKQHTDSFTLKTKAGSEKIINFVTTGVNDKPVVKELGQGENKYAGSANVGELINLDHFKSSPAINTDIKYKAKYDFDHVRTGQFLVSDVDVGDNLTVSNKATKPDEKIGNLETEILQMKDSNDNPIVGKYIVKWTYTVKDSDLDSLNTPTSGSSSKDDDFIVTINDGTTTVDTKIMLNLSGRNEIEFVDGENEGNNIILRQNGSDGEYENPGNDVIYFGDGYDEANAENGGDVIYGEGGNDNLNLNEDDSIIFGGDGIDTIKHYGFVKSGTLFGGNGSDKIIFNFFPSITGDNQKIYAWGNDGTDTFQQNLYQTSKIGNWIMDFNSSTPSAGGDKIDYIYLFNNNVINHSWDPFKTQLVTHTADASNLFLSEGAKYYELQVKSSVNSNDPNWYSVFNLVGTNGTDLTAIGLFANGNLV